MGFTEAASDDGVISGRGRQSNGDRGGCHDDLGRVGPCAALLNPGFCTGNQHAIFVVFVELWAIVWIQNRYMQTPFLRATFQVVLGGALVLPQAR